MIIPVKKYLFFGVQEDLDEFFEKAQNQGYIEFIPPSGKKPLETPHAIQNLLAALRILKRLPEKTPYLGGGSSDFAQEISEKIVILKSELDKLHEERRLLEAEIFRVAPFGEFSMDDVHFIEREGKRKIQFFCMKASKSRTAHFPDEVIYVGTVYDLDYFITINKKDTKYPEMIEMRIDRPLQELKSHLALVKESMHLLETELKSFSGHREFLRKCLVELLNDHNLISAKKEAQVSLLPTLFSIEAWIPENKVKAVFGMVDGMLIHAELVAKDETEKVPTYMENKGEKRLGEDLVRIYDIPSPRDKDPSGWVFWSFVFFFAMIVSDGGYGLVFLALAFFLKYKFPQAKGNVKRLFKLSFVLAIACILWGIATSSFFGMDFAPKSTFSKFSLVGYLAEKKAAYHIARQDDVWTYWTEQYPELKSVQDSQEFLDRASKVQEGKLVYGAFDDFKDAVLLEFALLIGVIHVSISLVRYLFRNFSGIGWIAFLVGGYLYFPLILHCTSLLNFLGVIDPQTAAKVGIQLIYGGIGAAFVLSIIQRRLKALAEITMVVQVFSDVLSYIRLYALALAGSMLASTFNDLGSGIGLVVGGLVILFGHLVNIQLGLMAGVIHGLRLNFIEWYHYSFEGGGKLFNPLRKIK